MICRDPAPWRAVLTDQTLALLDNPAVLPWRGEHGGYILARMDALGRVRDLHAAFEPAGWGKDAHATLKALLRHLVGWDLITATECADNWRSRPPKSFGFRPAAEMSGGYRTWILTRAAWEASPAFRRTE